LAHAEIYQYENITLDVFKILDQAKGQARNLREFVKLSNESGIDVKFFPNELNPTGISYATKIPKAISSYDPSKADEINAEDDRIYVVKGGTLGRGYTYAGIMKSITLNMEEESNQKAGLIKKMESCIDRADDFLQLFQRLKIDEIRIINSEKYEFTDGKNTVSIHELNQRMIEQFFRLAHALERARAKKNVNEKDFDRSTHQQQHTQNQKNRENNNQISY